MGMQQSYRKFFIVALVLHLFIFFILAMGFQVSGKTFVFENSKTPQVINAMVMQAPAPQPTVKPEPPAPPVPPTPPKVAQVKPEPIVKQPPKVIPVAPLPKVIPKPDTIALDKKRKKLQQEQLEKQLLADLKKTTQVQQKKLKQKALEDAFQSEIKNLAAKKKQLQQEQQRIAGEQEQKAQGEVDKYKALVLQAIGRHWLIPNNVDKKLATTIIIYLAPGGMVVDAEIYKSSGNPALDNSARTAVFKASPLPVPSDADGFKFFRRFVLVFRPMYFQNGQFGAGSLTSQEA